VCGDAGAIGFINNFVDDCVHGRVELIADRSRRKVVASVHRRLATRRVRTGCSPTKQITQYQKSFTPCV